MITHIELDREYFTSGTYALVIDYQCPGWIEGVEVLGSVIIHPNMRIEINSDMFLSDMEQIVETAKKWKEGKLYWNDQLIPFPG